LSQRHSESVLVRFRGRKRDNILERIPFINKANSFKELVIERERDGGGEFIFKRNNTFINNANSFRLLVIDRVRERETERDRERKKERKR
jgi:hypothetical protein